VVVVVALAPATAAATAPAATETQYSSRRGRHLQDLHIPTGFVSRRDFREIHESRQPGPPGCLGLFAGKTQIYRSVTPITRFSAPSPILCRCLAAGILLSLSLPGNGGLLYSTDFESFTTGTDNWVGTDGWIGNNTGLGVHGINQDIIPGGGLGKTAFIGYNQPNSTFVFVAKPINYTPASGGFPFIEVETLIGIQESSDINPNHDSFLVSIWNAAGNYLAGVRFVSHPGGFDLWRLDGTTTEHDTGLSFPGNDLHLLFLRIDLENNLWSAELGGVPLFENATFTASANTVDFGILAYEWQISAPVPTGHGDNWMLVADTMVRSAPRDTEPFRISSVTHTAGGTTLTWQGQNGFDYQVEYSDDQTNWLPDLPGSSFPDITADQVLSFTDPAATPSRFYRVVRTESP